MDDDPKLIVLKHVFLLLLDRSVPPAARWAAARLRVAAAGVRAKLARRRSAGATLEIVTATAVETGPAAVARTACLALITERADGPVELLREALASAWWAGERDLQELARAAKVSTFEVREHLGAIGVDAGAGTYGGPRLPEYRPVRAAEVRALAEVVQRVLSPAVLSTDPEPLVEAAWQLGIALNRVAGSVDPSLSAEEIAEAAQDLADRIVDALGYALQARAGLHTPLELAAEADRENVDRVVEGAVAAGAVVTVTLPVGHSVTVTVAHQPYGRPDAGYSTLTSPSPLVSDKAPLDGAEHLILRTALGLIDQVVTARLAEDAFEDR
ncbi:hypothetical protein ABTX81_30815 [Kitasatospora sp. NPDC097605]|uniref:hypothetical protein n=1 Tax=Kitasatospora sp. NPDC097605 TaxID=3157226 RepID=UPI00332A5DAE